MRKWIETTGRSEEDAIAAALFQLGLDRDDVSVEVIDRAKPGFLGFGGNPAKVRVSYGPDDQPDEAPAVPAEEVPVAPAKDGLLPDDEVIIAKEAAPAADDAKAQRIREFITGLMAQMQVDATPEVTRGENGYQVVLQGTGLGAIIGRRGETLDAIQQLTNYTVNRGQSSRTRIHVDAEGYRAKREAALEALARKIAGKVVKYRKNVTLEAMNAYERHVIHSALQEYPDVTTYSTGTEPNRRTVVAYAPGEHR
ncbi:MAG: protein jag [Oscillospiraceae bacterium]|nr:protein jag [Oscillospiraceae bacterium]